MSKLILLVDDDAKSLASLRPVLERAGHRVVTAPGGRKAAQELAATHFDVIVTDVFMPELDGLELIRLARIADPQMRVVAISDYDRHNGYQVLAIARQLGADAALQKPIAAAQLLNAVEDAPAGGPPPMTNKEKLTNAAEI